MSQRCLCQLPESFLAMIMLHWIDIGSVRALDHAVCARTFRKKLVKLLSDHIIFSTLVDCSVENLNWLASRRIRLNKIDIDSNTIAKYGKSAEIVFKSNGETLSEITYRQLYQLSSLRISNNIAQSCKNLLKLYYEGESFGIEIRNILRVAKDSLKELKLSGIRNISNVFKENLSMLHLRVLILHCPIPGTVVIGDSGIGSLKGLRELAISNVPLDSGMIQAIKNIGKELLVLVINGGKHGSTVDASLITSLPRHCPKLRVLSIGDIPAGGISVGISASQHLLSIPVIGSVTSLRITAEKRPHRVEGILAVLALDPAWGQKLKYIVLPCESASTHKMADIIGDIANHCVNLEGLRIFSATQPSSLLSSYVRLANQCPQLRELDLSNVRSSEGILRHIGQRCLHMQHLCVQFESDISPAAVRSGLNALVALKELIWYCAAAEPTYSSQFETKINEGRTTTTITNAATVSAVSKDDEEIVRTGSNRKMRLLQCCIKDWENAGACRRAVMFSPNSSGEGSLLKGVRRDLPELPFWRRWL